MAEGAPVRAELAAVRPAMFHRSANLSLGLVAGRVLLLAVALTSLAVHGSPPLSQDIHA